MLEPFMIPFPSEQIHSSLREPAFNYNLCHTNSHPHVTFFFNAVLNSEVLGPDALFYLGTVDMDVSFRQDIRKTIGLEKRKEQHTQREICSRILWVEESSWVKYGAPC